MAHVTSRMAGARRWMLAGLCAWLCGGFGVAPVSAQQEAAADDELTLQMSERTREFLEDLLGDERMAKLNETLAVPEAWGSLGPHVDGGPAPLPVDPPERAMDLTIPDDAPGSGTADDPYVDVISVFLDAQFEYEPVSIEAYYSHPEPGEVEEYISSLGYEPTVVRVPAGHYRETPRTQERPYRQQDQQFVGVDVPPGVWLVAEGEVVVEPGVEKGTASTLMNLNIRAGLVDFTLDGGTVPFEPNPDTRVHGVATAHEAVIAGNRIRDFTGRGITAVGSRGREGSDAVVVDNIIENIGYSGISTQSRWLVRDNQVRYAGVLRPTGGNGDDAIIPRWGVENEIVNNLLVMEHRPHGRHSISGQATHDNLFAGNISIVDGPLRNNVGLSDGSHRNRLIGNAILNVREWYMGGQQLVGIAVNGYGNELRHNFIVGHPIGVNIQGREGEALSIVADNYIEYVRQSILWQYSNNYTMKRNEVKQSGHRHPDLAFGSPLSAGPRDPAMWFGDFAYQMEENFGFFRHVEAAEGN